MRTTRGKPTLGVRTEGDVALARALVEALRAEDRQDRWTHGFHTYPAGLHPDAARDLLGLCPDGPVHDPFCGGGTVLVEALVAGRRATGSDLSDVALRVARARTAKTTEADRTLLRSTARKLTAAAREADRMPPPGLLEVVGPWYAPTALVELEALRTGIAEAEVDDAVRDLLWTCFSSILVKVSHRASDTSARREVQRRPAGTTAILFHKKVRELGRRLEALADAVPPGTPVVRVAHGDACAPWSVGDLAAVVTSPPYPAVYDYLPLQTLREAWLGTTSRRDAELGARRHWREDPVQAVARWRADTTAWVGRAAEALAPGGWLVVVVGDGLVDGRTVASDRGTLEAAASAGLATVARATLTRPDHARRATRDEHVLVFERR